MLRSVLFDRIYPWGDPGATGVENTIGSMLETTPGSPRELRTPGLRVPTSVGGA